MSDLSSASYCKDNSCGCGSSPIFMILMLLLLCGGDNGIFGCLGGSGNGSSCGCGSGGMNGMLPILLIPLLLGGSLF
jgi:hypothetical protein